MSRLIDADALREFLNRQYHSCHGYGGNKKEVYREAILAVKSYVHREGQLDAVPVVHGRWVWTERGEDDYEQYYVCSECGSKQYFETTYCPHCGAKMDGGRK